jgi:hypothetical protein
VRRNRRPGGQFGTLWLSPSAGPVIRCGRCEGMRRGRTAHPTHVSLCTRRLYSQDFCSISHSAPCKIAWHTSLATVSWLRQAEGGGRAEFSALWASESRWLASSDEKNSAQSQIRIESSGCIQAIWCKGRRAPTAVTVSPLCTTTRHHYQATQDGAPTPARILGFWHAPPKCARPAAVSRQLV